MKPVLVTYLISLDDLDAELYHAALTDQGQQKRECSDWNLQLEGDYVVKQGGFDWIAFSKVPSTDLFWNTQISQHRRRAVVVVFVGSSVPRHHAGEHQRAAATCDDVLSPVDHQETRRHVRCRSEG